MKMTVEQWQDLIGMACLAPVFIFGIVLFGWDELKKRRGKK